MRNKKSNAQSQRANKRAGMLPEQQMAEALPPPARRKAEPFEPKNERQRAYASAMRRVGNIVFGLGPAGTGKTYVAGSIAADMLLAHEVERIILTRPAVEAGGENLGFLPGEKEQKFDPYFDPFREVLEERLGKSFVEYLIKEGRIKCEPFAYMRGKTFKNAFVILDEGQNATAEQYKLFLSRIGEGAIVVVNGDQSQSDIKGKSGLMDAAARLFHLPSVKVVAFRKADIVRSGLVQEIIEAYERPAPDLHPSLQH
jgi:phosphate starvation-inducible PhoH-like protein